MPNIGLRGRRRRIISGVLCLGTTAAVFAALAIRHAGVAAYFLLAPLTAYTALFFFQAKEKTWVVLAPRGLREEDDGKTRVRMAEEWLVAVRRQARRVWVQTLTATVLVTAAAIAFALLR